MVPPHQPQWPQQHYPPPPQHDPVRAAATRAMIMSLIAVPLCCAPIGIAGIFFGVQAMSMAKQRGSSAPTRALVAIALGAFSILMLAGGGVGFYLDQKARAERLAEADKKTKGKLEDEKLDKAVACALLEKHLLNRFHFDTEQVHDLSCGKWESDEKLGRLKGAEAKVIGDVKTFDACFARARRWFLLSIAEPGEDCPKEPVEAKKGECASDADCEAEEEELRKGAKERVAKQTVKAFDDLLVKVRDQLEDVEANEKKCGKLDLGGAEKRVVSTVDFEYLKNTKTERDDWSFLTSDRVKHALDEKRSYPDRAKDIQEIHKEGGRYLVVYIADARDWPETIKPKGILGKKGFAAGGLDGWMLVFDTKDMKVACQTELTFENSKSVGVGKWAGDKGIASALKEDLKKNYETAASKKLRELTDGKLRLGFSPLD